MELIKQLEVHFEAARDQLVASQQSAYMKNLFPFHGIKKPARALIQKKLFRAHPVHSEQELIRILHLLWEKPEREYQMTALDLAYTYKKLWTPTIFPHFETLIRTKSWWDSVDTLAAKLVGPLIRKYPALQIAMDDWIKDENMWIRRSAIIYQLSYKDATDSKRLFTYCKQRMHEKDFFIRKAIGWSLRQYARTNPEAIRLFIETEKSSLSPLSYREAAKHLV